MRLRSLSNNKAIKVCKMDKGTGVVIMSVNEYHEKLDFQIRQGKPSRNKKLTQESDPNK